MTWSRNFNFEPIPMKNHVTMSNNRNISIPFDQTTAVDGDDRSELLGHKYSSKNASAYIEPVH